MAVFIYESILDDHIWTYRAGAVEFHLRWPYSSFSLLSEPIKNEGVFAQTDSPLEYHTKTHGGSFQTDENAYVVWKHWCDGTDRRCGFTLRDPRPDLGKHKFILQKLTYATPCSSRPWFSSEDLPLELAMDRMQSLTMQSFLPGYRDAVMKIRADKQAQRVADFAAWKANIPIEMKRRRDRIAAGTSQPEPWETIDI